MTDLTLYHCPHTRSATAFWMNEEVGAPARIEVVNLKTGAHKSPAHLARNPMGKVPALLDGETIITETAAICAHLADRFPSAGLAPAPGTPARGAYYRWLFFAPSVIEPMMLDRLSGAERQNPGSAGHGSPDSVLSTLRGALADRDYLIDDSFTAADLVLGSTLRFAMMFGAIEKEPAFEAYVNRLAARPAAEAASKKDAELAERLASA
ncbi:MAG: glutathione S-transferase [Alphaproteobacteria bacterium]|nr:glutathione S-transferase [Alphaproteobacteria bacterium]